MASMQRHQIRYTALSEHGFRSDDVRNSQATEKIVSRRILILCLLPFLIIICAGGRTIIKFFGKTRFAHVREAFKYKYLLSTEICTTPVCLRAATELLQSITSRPEELDPCEDFRKYSCESWDTTHFMRDDQSNIFTGTILDDKTDLLVRDLLEADLHGHDVAKKESIEIENYRKVQHSYNACMNEMAIERVGLKPLADIIRQLIKPNNSLQENGTWVSPEATSNNSGSDQSNVGARNIAQVLASFLRNDVNAVIRFDAVFDSGQSTMFLQLGLPLLQDWPTFTHYQDRAFVLDYTTIVAQVLALLPSDTLNFDESSSSMPPLSSTEMAAAIIEFESDIANATYTYQQAAYDPASYDLLSLAELQSLLPEIDVRTLLLDLGIQHLPEKVVVKSRDYLRSVSMSIRNSDPRVFHVYLSWKLIQRFYSYVETEATRPLRGYLRLLAGQDPSHKRERWRTCIRYADESLGWILSRLYVEQSLPEAHETYSREITTRLIDEAKRSINSTLWMNEATRDSSVRKVDMLSTKLGYSVAHPDTRSPSSLHAYYSAVNISATNFFGNAASTARFRFQHRINTIGDTKRPDMWDRNSLSSNAYYNREANEIVIPAGFMQEPAFYGEGVPSYLTYGAFGAVVAHEISHAFDATGRLYDASGTRADWWDNASIAEFENRTHCFIVQYSNYTMALEESERTDGHHVHVDGDLTLSENLADVNGLKTAFSTWRRVEESHPSQALPGLTSFTNEQLFFLSFGRFWCAKARRENLLERFKVDPHSPSDIRIIGTLEDSAEFREAFGCRERTATCELF